MNHRLLTIVAAILALTVAHGAAAQEAKHLGSFGDWEAFAAEGGAYCYAGSKPTKQEGKYASRGDAFLLVTNRPKEKSFDVVSIEAGYTYKEGSEAAVTIAGQNFTLFTHGGQAWARDPAGDAALVKAMRAGAAMVVVGTSSRGTRTTDTYSLKGFSAAHQAIGKACLAQ